MPTQHTLGQRPPVLLEALARCLPASWCLKTRRQILLPRQQRRRGANHAMVHMMPVPVNERQNDTGGATPHVEIAYSSSVSTATGLAPNEMHEQASRSPSHVF